MSESVMPREATTRFPSLGMVKRELLTSLRTKRSIAIVMGFMGLAMLVILSEWPSMANSFGMNVGMAGYQSQLIIEMLSVSMYGGCVLFVPAYSASAIVIER